MSETPAVPRRAAEAFRNIALIRLSSVGDVIMALPALEALREAHPQARITWIVEGRARNVLEGHPALDAIIEFPRDAWRRQWRRPLGIPRSVPSVLAFYRGLRRQRFDVTLDFQGNLKSATCTLAARAPLRIGYAREECREPNHLFTNRRLSLGGQAIHRMERDLLLAGLAGAPFRLRRPRIAYDEEDRRVGEATIPSRGDVPVVVLHPGTSPFMPHKRWSLGSYARLGDILAAEGRARILLSWGPGEEGMVGEIAARMERPAEVLPATPSIKSLGYLLARADLVIGGDTGPFHLAVVQGVDAIGILGPSDPRHYYPLGHPERVFYRRLPCSPCRHRACPDLTCLRDIPPEAVARRALDVLATRGA